MTNNTTATGGNIPKGNGFYKLTGHGSMDGIYLLVFHDPHDHSKGHNLFVVRRNDLYWTYPDIITILDADNWLSPEQAVQAFREHEDFLESIPFANWLSDER